jgi:hypothetical protein
VRCRGAAFDPTNGHGRGLEVHGIPTQVNDFSHSKTMPVSHKHHCRIIGDLIWRLQSASPLPPRSDTPAHQAGLLIGDEILAADDLPFRPVTSFRDKVGVPVTLSIRRDPGGPPMALSVTPAAIHPNAMFLRGLQASGRVVTTANAVRVGYVHVWSYAGGVYQRALEDQIVDGPLRDADALVWDLRDGWGGAKPQYLDLFNPNAPTMQMTLSLDPLGEHLHRTVQLRVPAGRINRIERHLDRRPDADSFETLAIDGHVRNCQQQQVPIVHQEGGSR